jgi:hypothetical protein
MVASLSQARALSREVGREAAVLMEDTAERREAMTAFRRVL